MADTFPLPGYTHATLIAALLPVVAAVGKLQMTHFRRGVPVETKADATPVTVADQESERLILAELARLTPMVPVVAEEAMASGEKPDPANVFFLVDPLDGTREFIEGRDEFTVNIALVEGDRPVFGLVYAPALGDLYVTLGVGDAAHAVWRGADARNFDSVGLKPIRARVGDRKDLVALVSRSHLTPATKAFLQQHGITRTRAAGSSLKFCLIAAGEADVYPRAGRTSEWDTAAGQAVLEAAGGRVTTFDRRPLSYGKAEANYRNPDYVAWGAGLP